MHKTALPFALIAIVFLVFSSPGALAHAQTTAPLTLDAEAEWTAIATQSHHATGLYVAGACFLGQGLVLGAIGGVAILSSAFGGGNSDGAVVFALGNLVGAGVGLLLFIPAIVLDVDAGARRRRHEDRLRGGTTVGVSPVGLSLTTTF